MSRHLYIIFLVTFLAFAMTMAFATPIPNNTSNPKTFLGPTGRIGATKALGDNGAFSFAGEAGVRNFRVSGTFGWQADYYQRIKASIELLRQKITYSFFDGRESPWVNQGAVGANYEYLFHNQLPYPTMFDLSAYFSHAPSRTLGTATGNFISGGDIIDYSVLKRIAGSNAAGVSPGIKMIFPYGTSAGFELNYDNVRYDTVYRARSADAKGFGGTVRLAQAITNDLAFGVSAAVRQPFNNYQADISWTNIPYNGTWIFRIFGAYTIGKNSLPTTYNVGIGADYLIDARDEAPPFPAAQCNTKFKDQPVYKDQIIPPVEWNEGDLVDKEFLSWVSDPAVYMPQVLAIADQRVLKVQRVTEICLPPVQLVAFVDTIPPGFPFVLDVAPFFSGSNLTFSFTVIAGDAATVSISGSEITFTGFSGNVTLTVTATNACGSVTSNAFTIIS